MVLGHPAGPPAHRPGGGERPGQHQRHQNPGGPQAEPRPGNEVAVLENRFIDLARQIADQWDRLADSDRQRREFVANISHDLRTPLTSLLGYLETLTLKDEWLTAEERRQYLTIALRQGNKVRHLSQQLFELARLEHGGIKPQRERFAMGS